MWQVKIYSSVTLPTSPTPGCQIEDLIVVIYIYIHTTLRSCFKLTDLTISCVPSAQAQQPRWLNPVMSVTIGVYWVIVTQNFINALFICMGTWGCGWKLAWPHWGAVREMKEHPDGTSKKPPDKPWGYRWGSHSSRAAVLVCHLNFFPTSPSLHVHVSASKYSCSDWQVIHWNGYKLCVLVKSLLVL